jgi:antitoxin YefM
MATATLKKRVSYTEARERLASLLDEVVDDREVVVITRRGREDVAVIAADELSSLLETAHLLRSPENARRLLTALNRARSRKTAPQTVADLRRELKLDQDI